MAEDWPKIKARHTRHVTPWMAIIERERRRGYGLRTEPPWWKTRPEEDRVDEAEKGASSAIAGPRSSTAAPSVSPDCTRRRAVLVALGVCRRQPRPWCVLCRQRWREIILGEVV